MATLAATSAAVPAMPTAATAAPAAPEPAPARGERQGGWWQSLSDKARATFQGGAIGAVVGGALGFVVGGPIGAVIGALAGSVLTFAGVRAGQYRDARENPAG